MSENAKAAGVNRAKLYQLVLFPLNNGATNVYYVLVLSYIATFGSNVLALGTLFASVMVTAMRLCDAITDPIIGALMDRTNGRFGKFRPFMAIGNLIMAVSILILYGITPMIPDTMMWARYAAFVGLYFVWVIERSFQKLDQADIVLWVIDATCAEEMQSRCRLPSPLGFFFH